MASTVTIETKDDGLLYIEIDEETVCDTYIDGETALVVMGVVKNIAEVLGLKLERKGPDPDNINWYQQEAEKWQTRLKERFEKVHDVLADLEMEIEQGPEE